MDLAERSYWDQYDNDADYFASHALPSQHQFSSVSTDASSRDSYWSRYISSAKSTATEHRAPVSRSECCDDEALSAIVPESAAPVTSATLADVQAQQRRLFVMPERLAALRLDTRADERENQHSRSRGKMAVPSGVEATVAQNITRRSSSNPPVTPGGGGVLEQKQQIRSACVGQKDKAHGGNALHANNAETTVQHRLDPDATAVSEKSSSQNAASSNDVDEAPIDSPLTRSYKGVNPAALITRLNFLKEQMDQDERLFLNPIV